MVAWCIHCKGVRYLLHYLDDFLILGTAGTYEATGALEVVYEFLTRAGIPVAHQKTKGPSTTISFLGILIDTLRFELRLPADKLARLTALVSRWRIKRSCSKKELESFVGHLAHAAIVIRPGRIFLRSLFNLLSVGHRPQFFLCLNCAVRADILWWHYFLQAWNGSSFFPPPTPSIHIYSDASGSFGCGAIDFQVGWFQAQWPERWASSSIASMQGTCSDCHSCSFVGRLMAG